MTRTSQTIILPGVVLRERLFAPFDRRYSLTLLLDEAAAALASEAAYEAASKITEGPAVHLAVAGRVRPEGRQDYRATGFTHRLRANTKTPPAVLRHDGEAIEVWPRPKAESYQEGTYGVEQGARVHVCVSFKGYVRGSPGVAAYLNSVLVGREVIELPRAPVASPFAHLIDWEAGSEPAGGRESGSEGKGGAAAPESAGGAERG